jgi:trigger factor
VAAQFILDAVAKKAEVGVDQNELTQEMLRRAQQSGENPNDYIKHMMDHNHVPEIVSDIVRAKALAAIVESATVTDASGNVLDLKNLRPDGTIGEPADDADQAPAEPEAPAENAEAAEDET